MLVQEKIAGGKLLCVDAEFSGTRIARIRITGDFFLHPEETIERIERGLEGAECGEVAGIVANVLRDGRARLIGAAPEDVGRLVRRALQ